MWIVLNKLFLTKNSSKIYVTSNKTIKRWPKGKISLKWKFPKIKIISYNT